MSGPGDGRIADVIGMLERLVPRDMNVTSGQIGLRSGASFPVVRVSLKHIPEDETQDGVVLAYSPRQERSFDEIRFLASDVEYVRKDGVHLISPERFEKMQGQIASDVIAATVKEGVSVNERFGDIAEACLATRPEWFLDAARASRPGTREDDAPEDGRDTPMDVGDAVVAIVVSTSYEAVRRSYLPFMTEKEWVRAAMDMIDPIVREKSVGR